MKFNAVLSLVALGLSGLLAYLVYDVAKEQEYGTFAGIGSFVCFLLCFELAIGISLKDGRQTVNLKVLSWIAVIIFHISQFAFAYTTVKMPYYLVVNGLLLMIFIGIAYSIININKSN